MSAGAEALSNVVIQKGGLQMKQKSKTKWWTVRELTGGVQHASCALHSRFAWRAAGWHVRSSAFVSEAHTYRGSPGFSPHNCNRDVDTCALNFDTISHPHVSSSSIQFDRGAIILYVQEHLTIYVWRQRYPSTLRFTSLSPCNKIKGWDMKAADERFICRLMYNYSRV